MADQETLLERLIPGDLEHQIPAAIRKALPGGFRNRLLQAGLGLLITLGFAFMVRRWIERRETRRRVLAPRPVPPSLPRAEPEVRAAMAAPWAPPPDPVSGDATALLARPHLVLAGPVDQAMYASFRAQLAGAPQAGPLVLSLSTQSGDGEIARLMGDEIRLLRDYSARDTLFLGKVAVHSAGLVLMAAFPADRRFLTRGTRLTIREAVLMRTVTVSGPLRACAAGLKATLDEIEDAVRIEEEGLRAMVEGSHVRFEDVQERARAGWTIEAGEARDLGLVHDVI